MQQRHGFFIGLGLFLQLAFLPPCFAETWFDGFSHDVAGLQDESGKVVSFEQWKGHPVVLTMSYTNCRKICPHLTLTKLKEIDQKVKDAEIIVITFDPENDTPDQLARYRKTQKLDQKNWHFLTGSKELVKKSAERLGLQGFFEMDDHIVHDFKILIVGKSGEIERKINWDHRDL